MPVTLVTPKVSAPNRVSSCAASDTLVVEPDDSVALPQPMVKVAKAVMSPRSARS